MRDKKKFVVAIITLIAAGVFCFTLYTALFYAPTDEIPLPQAMEDNTPAPKDILTSVPVRLIIPKLNSDAKIQQVGITKAGNMATPNNFTDVGWFKYGVLPGEEGSAVIAGHVDNGIAFPGVFFHLSDLAIGDDIFVTGSAGETLHFVVERTDTYAFDAKNTNVFTEKDGKLLKLITCAGTFVKANGTHDKRLVVTAVLAEN